MEQADLWQLLSHACTGSGNLKGVRRRSSEIRHSEVAFILLVFAVCVGNVFGIQISTKYQTISIN